MMRASLAALAVGTRHCWAEAYGAESGPTNAHPDGITFVSVFERYHRDGSPTDSPDSFVRTIRSAGAVTRIHCFDRILIRVGAVPSLGFLPTPLLGLLTWRWDFWKPLGRQNPLCPERVILAFFAKTPTLSSADTLSFSLHFIYISVRRTAGLAHVAPGDGLADFPVGVSSDSGACVVATANDRQRRSCLDALALASISGYGPSGGGEVGAFLQLIDAWRAVLPCLLPDGGGSHSRAPPPRAAVW